MLTKQVFYGFLSWETKRHILWKQVRYLLDLYIEKNIKIGNILIHSGMKSNCPLCSLCIKISFYQACTVISCSVLQFYDVLWYAIYIICYEILMQGYEICMLWEIEMKGLMIWFPIVCYEIWTKNASAYSSKHFEVK